MAFAFATRSTVVEGSSSRTPRVTWLTLLAAFAGRDTGVPARATLAVAVGRGGGAVCFGVEPRKGVPPGRCILSPRTITEQCHSAQRTVDDREQPEKSSRWSDKLAGNCHK